MKIEIEISPMTIATRDGASVEFDPAKISDPTIFANLIAYGIGQKVRDARSGAQARAEETKEDVTKVSTDMMSDAVAALYRGEWSQRGTGAGVDEFTSVARPIMRQMMKAALSEKDWAKFTGLSDADQLVKIDANIEANREALTDPVAEAIAERKRKAEAKRKLAGKVTISI
jgi:hypothetical protein